MITARFSALPSSFHQDNTGLILLGSRRISWCCVSLPKSRLRYGECRRHVTTTASTCMPDVASFFPISFAEDTPGATCVICKTNCSPKFDHIKQRGEPCMMSPTIFAWPRFPSNPAATQHPFAPPCSPKDHLRLTSASWSDLRTTS